MKKKLPDRLRGPVNFRKTLLFMKFYLVFTLFLTVTVSASVYSQNEKVSFTLEAGDLSNVLIRIKDMTGVQIIYNENQLGQLTCRKLSLKQVTAVEAIDEVLKGTGFYCEQINGVFVIKLVPEQQQQASDLIQIKGKVTDEKGNPMPGATVQLYGTSIGVSTDVDGHYTINAKRDAVLRISFIGYKTQDISVNGRTAINVSLKPEAESLEEVTVVAFGQQKKESVVSSITTVRPSDS